MFFRKTKQIKKLQVQVSKLFRQNKSLQHENEILRIFLKEIELIQKENHYGSVDNYTKKIKSAITDAHRLLHFWNDYENNIIS